MVKKINIAVFISGRGTNLNSLIKYSNSKYSKINIKLVISNNAKAKGLIYAKKSKIKFFVRNFKNTDISEKEIIKLLNKFKIDLICLAGFMKILSKKFISNFKKPILNIHPSLLPDFPGAHAHRDVIAAKATKSGCTVHFVDSGMDSGPIIAQEEVEVLATDDEKSLAQKVKEKEHLLYPMVIDMLSAGEIESP